jgi:HD-GYP domain-containing protein (c-di-GMP phosphodiesterase class II)
MTEKIRFLLPQEGLKIETPKESLFQRYKKFEQQLSSLWQNFGLTKETQRATTSMIAQKVIDLFSHFPESFAYLTIEELSEILIALLESHSPVYAQHSRNVATNAYNFAFQSGIRDKKILKKIYYAGLLHDIGKLVIPGEILHSENGITDEQKKILKKHIYFSRLILSLFPQTREIAEKVWLHHERFDGKGYYKITTPLSENDFFWYVMLADYYTALTEKRPYKDPLRDWQAMEKIFQDRGALPPNILKSI